MNANDKSSEALTLELSQRHGEVMGGEKLWRAFGYNTLAAFKQAITRGSLTLPTFFIEGRKGRHALTKDVATWLIKCRANAGQPSKIKLPASFNRKKSKLSLF